MSIGPTYSTPVCRRDRLDTMRSCVKFRINWEKQTNFPRDEYFSNMFQTITGVLTTLPAMSAIGNRYDCPVYVLRRVLTLVTIVLFDRCHSWFGGYETSCFRAANLNQSQVYRRIRLNRSSMNTRKHEISNETVSGPKSNNQGMEMLYS